jgi:hypothetical protein
MLFRFAALTCALVRAKGKKRARFPSGELVHFQSGLAITVHSTLNTLPHETNQRPKYVVTSPR